MYLFVNSEDGDELSNALTDRRRMRVKPGVEPSNMRILLADILTFDGLFGAKFDILKPRWPLTGVRLVAELCGAGKGLGSRSVADLTDRGAP